MAPGQVRPDELVAAIAVAWCSGYLFGATEEAERKNDRTPLAIVVGAVALGYLFANTIRVAS